MNSDAIRQHVATMWDQSIIPTLHEYIRIPNKSPAFDRDWEKHGYMDDATNLLVKWVSQSGISGLVHRVVRLEGRTPLILIDIPGEGGNVLMYGHFDKQPEFTGWEDGLGPWTPVEKDGRLYGRGGADDGYAIFASLAAIGALQAQNLPHPRCLILIESCEESGSYDLPSYIDHLADEIGQPDLVICLDAECGNYDQLWLTTSLRGTLGGTLNVEVLSEGVHSGAAGGIVPSSFRLLRQLLDRVENAVSGELLDFLQVPIPSDVRVQADRVASTLGSTVLDRFPWSGSTRPAITSSSELVVANTWGSSMAVVGLAGAPEPSNAGNTLRPSTAAKLVFRLPPSLDADEAANRVKSTLEKDPPQGATVSFDLESPQTGWHAKSLSPKLLASLDHSSKTFFGAPMMTMGTGGTIPFMKMLGDRFPACQFFVTGVLGPHSNAHGPNEFLHIDTGKRVTCCVAEVLADRASQT
ncbi:M20/M25/M40 family metallo-hydrolase [Gammaproteobacteria bacterium]|nr:M20/M25/M40 family metallo-hydrolase [Gammaproteobacteria bacterium]